MVNTQVKDPCVIEQGKIKDRCPFVFFTPSEVEYLIVSYSLTSQETAVIRAIVTEGMSQRVAARELQISRRAVRNALGRIEKRVFE